MSLEQLIEAIRGRCTGTPAACSRRQLGSATARPRYVLRSFERHISVATTIIRGIVNELLTSGEKMLIAAWKCQVRPFNEAINRDLYCPRRAVASDCCSAPSATCRLSRHGVVTAMTRATPSLQGSRCMFSRSTRRRVRNHIPRAGPKGALACMPGAAGFRKV
jgi:hypothetical protein